MSKIRIQKIKLIIAGVLALAFSSGMLINSIGQFILPIHNDMGYSVGVVSLAFSIISLGMIFSATIFVKIIDKYSPKVCMAVSASILAISILSISFTTEIWQFYICTTIIGLAFTGLHTLPVSVMINEAFSERRKGLAFSLVFSGSGLGGMVFNPLFNYVIEKFDWRIGFCVMSGLCFIGGIVIVLLIGNSKNIIKKSEYIEIDTSEIIAADPHKEEKIEDLTYEEAIKTPAFWRMSFGMLIVTGSGVASMMHNVPYMVYTGIDSTTASYMFSVYMLTLALSKVGLGFICDKLGIVKAVKIGLTCLTLSIMSLLLLNLSSVYYVIYLLIGGTGGATATVCTPIMTSYLFGNKDYTKIFGATIVFTGIGSAVFPYIVGAVYDLTGSYGAGWAFISILLVIAFCLYMINFKHPPKKK